MNVVRKKGTHNWNMQTLIDFSYIKPIDKALKYGNDHDNDSDSDNQIS